VAAAADTAAKATETAGTNTPRQRRFWVLRGVALSSEASRLTVVRPPLPSDAWQCHPPSGVGFTFSRSIELTASPGNS
jgi:hypothetical protein